MIHMLLRLPTDRQIGMMLGLAVAFWYLTFAAKVMNFWLSMSLAAVVLTTLTISLVGSVLHKADITWKNFSIGIVSAGALYVIFAIGNSVSQLVFHFARPEIASIYNIRNEGEALAIGFVLLFVTSPAEELVWRGFLQRWAMHKFGNVRGYLLSSCIYGLIHIFSGNFMLIMAALVAGLFWGYLYWKTDSMFACIVSHACWTVSIFVLWPIGG